MDAFDTLAQDVSQASSPFDLANKWSDLRAGFAALAAWKQATEDRLAKLEAAQKREAQS